MDIDATRFGCRDVEDILKSVHFRAGFSRVDASLALPDVRAAIEAMCDHVARGDAPRAVVVDHAIANFERKYAYLVANVGLMDELFDAVFEERPDDDGTRPPFARCGLTGQYLQLVPRPNRLFNPFTKEPCVFKAKPASKTVRCLPMKRLKEML